jgi:16S rRNA (uracil1498-N3)-methyltransferase
LTSNRFFIKNENIHYPYVTLCGPEHSHLSRVARVKPNNKVWLFSEKGVSFLTKVIDISPSQTKLIILEEREEKLPPIKIFLAQALLKSKSMDLVIKKSTELGVMSIIPVITQRTVVRIDARIEKKVERWKKLVIEASKQCGRSLLPEISSPVSLSELMKKEVDAWCLYLSENGGTFLRDIIFSCTDLIERGGCMPESVIILIGPEGGWTTGEEEALEKNGYEAVYLGKNILRAETAAICSLAILSHFWNS